METRRQIHPKSRRRARFDASAEEGRARDGSDRGLVALLRRDRRCWSGDRSNGACIESPGGPSAHAVDAAPPPPGRRARPHDRQGRGRRDPPLSHRPSARGGERDGEAGRDVGQGFLAARDRPHLTTTYRNGVPVGAAPVYHDDSKAYFEGFTELAVRPLGYIQSDADDRNRFHLFHDLKQAGGDPGSFCTAQLQRRHGLRVAATRTAVGRSGSSQFPRNAIIRGRDACMGRITGSDR